MVRERRICELGESSGKNPKAGSRSRFCDFYSILRSMLDIWNPRKGKSDLSYNLDGHRYGDEGSITRVTEARRSG